MSTLETEVMKTEVHAPNLPLKCTNVSNQETYILSRETTRLSSPLDRSQRPLSKTTLSEGPERAKKVAEIHLLALLRWTETLSSNLTLMEKMMMETAAM